MMKTLPVQLPDLPPPVPEGDSSDELGEEKDPKRERSTSTPSKSGRGLEPFECDKLM